MGLLQATLVRKDLLTTDVFELEYQLSEKKEFIPGQFITFILPGIGGRAYSILEQNNESIILVIKRWSLEMWGRGWSLALCDAEIGSVFKAVGPAGHFILSQSDASRCFLATGTGLVPLYAQIVDGLQKSSDAKYQLVFWVRTSDDLYYIERFEALKEQYPNTFYYHLCVSRDESHGIIHQWYVTDFLSAKSVSDFTEFYICGAPAMIEGCQKKLTELWVSSENIFFEKYA